MKKKLFIFLFGILAMGNASAQSDCCRHENVLDTTRQEVVSKQSHPFRLKTNILYDVLLIPNVSAELHVKNNWSLSLGYWYAWWKSNASHRYWRSYGGEIGVRKYFGSQSAKQLMTGHHLGLESQMGMYDVEFSKRGNMSDFSYTLGAEYGYAFPISSRINMDLSMALGYFGGRYKVYDPKESHYVWSENRNRKYIGPVKAEISFSVLLGKIEKGGK